MHIMRLFLGDDLVLRYVYTPLFDRVLTLPMIYAGVVGLLTWSRTPANRFMEPTHNPPGVRADLGNAPGGLNEERRTAVITAHPQSNTNQGSVRTARGTALRANGAFLALVGGTQVIFELLSHFFGVGPWGRIFAGSHYTIGFLEAHGLALLIGLLLIFVAAAEPKRFWHGFTACVHVLLGGANLLFWSSFVYWGLVPMGAIATVFHGLFLVAQLVFFVRTSTDERKDQSQ